MPNSSTSHKKIPVPETARRERQHLGVDSALDALRELFEPPPEGGGKARPLERANERSSP
jgi:hypothetical protein